VPHKAGLGEGSAGSFASIDELASALEGASYLPVRALTTTLYLGLALGKPVLLEGEAGVGKTERPVRDRI
jgi:MoxR-like ATPase